MPDLSDCRVLVTPTSYGRSDASLRSDLEALVGEVIYNPAGHPLSEDELRDLLPNVDGMIAGLDFITARALESANRLRVIARYGVGTDRVDLAAAESRGIVVTNTPGANSTSVAELTVALIFAMLRNIPRADAATKQGDWPRLSGSTLTGKTLGLLGLGAIGRAVAKMLSGFECRIIGFDPMVSVDAAAEWGVTWMERDAVVAAADILSLHLPVLPQTQDMVDAAFIAGMKEGAYLVNTARSELVMEDALLHALQSGKLAGAALDTFRDEPPQPDNPLLGLDNVIATPHTGAHTDGATNAMGRMALDECLAVLRGQEPKFRVI